MGGVYEQSLCPLGRSGLIVGMDFGVVVWLAISCVACGGYELSLETSGG